MNEDDLQREIDHLDYIYGVAMAYFGHLASMPEAMISDPSSDIGKHFRDHSDSAEHLNPAYLAWRALASASEHAGFAEHMRYITSCGVIARPQATLARVTLLGAARALYVLEPNSPEERAAKAAKLANQEATDAQKMLDAWSTQSEVPDDFLRDLERQTDQLADSAAAILVGAGMKERTTVNELTMLKETASQLRGVFEDGESRILTFWNRASGVSHARSWTWNTPYGNHPQFDFLETWSTPVELLAKAWKLWNSRRGVYEIPHFPPEEWRPDRTRWGTPPST